MEVDYVVDGGLVPCVALGVGGPDVAGWIGYAWYGGVGGVGSVAADVGAAAVGEDAWSVATAGEYEGAGE